MIRSVYQKARELVSQDATYISFAFVMTVCRTLVLFFMVINNLSLWVSYWTKDQFSLTNTMIEYALRLLDNAWLTAILVVLTVIVLLWYGLLYPVGEASMISYLHQEHKNPLKAFASWVSRFFPMFEFSGLNLWFSYLTLTFAIGRFYVSGVLDSIFIISFLVLRGVTILGMYRARAYVKILIVTQWMSVWDAISESIRLSSKNVRTTIKAIIVWYYLQVRFLLNLSIVLIGMIGLAYLMIAQWRVESQWITTTIYVVFFVMLIVASYINAIIEAFFMTYWYKVYESLKQ